ncbi:hydroxymethylglutaryl-CoA lyase [Shimazuella sp. AN120528]|uniref:hydroxymethylglutaryl-CoA lyase n=1 Tax=Shimazuella soli TaxID=1892854 RepID=UPI001F10AFAD|nr:hydroxymethylglutaryl-CoA lyase [Shimazuella soli]MCH5584027.1 hydroxymethylglutaryl-CoA lyase [Shimazuella soli]
MKVKIVEVGLRDGLQNEPKMLSTDLKLELINRLITANLTNLEITSFVHPRWIPQLADADQLVPKLTTTNKKISYRALVPNLKGMERVKSPPLTEIAVFVSASETHNLKNVNGNIKSTIDQIAQIVQKAKIYALPVRGYISCVFGCPYEGEVSLAVVENLCSCLFDLGVYEVSLGDTIGIAVPKQVKQVLQSLQTSFSGKLAMHFHDTRGLALVNTYMALENGVTTFDSSIGGIGGCPYAPGASGNVATEEVITLLHGLGVETGIDLNTLCETAHWLQSVLGKKLPSKVLQYYLSKGGNEG